MRLRSPESLSGRQSRAAACNQEPTGSMRRSVDVQMAAGRPLGRAPTRRRSGPHGARRLTDTGSIAASPGGTLGYRRRFARASASRYEAHSHADGPADGRSAVPEELSARIVTIAALMLPPRCEPRSRRSRADTGRRVGCLRYRRSPPSEPERCTRRSRRTKLLPSACGRCPDGCGPSTDAPARQTAWSRRLADAVVGGATLDRLVFSAITAFSPAGWYPDCFDEAPRGGR